jgi:hypothetical protein
MKKYLERFDIVDPKRQDELVKPNHKPLACLNAG